MLKLTRQVRFSIGQTARLEGPRNGHGGYPPVEGLDRFFVLQITLSGPQLPESGYVRNIVEIDEKVRSIAIPIIADAISKNNPNQYDLICAIFNQLQNAWPGSKLESVELFLSPFLSVARFESEKNIMRLSQKFEFSASHRLNNPKLSETENQSIFGKCNNLHGHGHNYEVQVTLIGTPDSSGTLMPTRQLEQIVLSQSIDKLDHKHLNVEVPEFKDLNPSVENIAKTIYQMIADQLQQPNCRLKSVTVWETPKTWCEYSPD